MAWFQQKGRTRRGHRFGALFAVLLLALALGGCGGVSPPAGIPAPVSNLMTIQGPDSNGVVAVLGQPGAVLPDAVVSAANLDQGGQVLQASLWSRWILGLAHAQTSNSSFDQSERDVVAASDGSFRMQLTGNQGDTLRFVQNVAGDKSPPTDLTVPPPVTPLPEVPPSPTPDPFI